MSEPLVELHDITFAYPEVPGLTGGRASMNKCAVYY
jgi:hypothetical protein